MKYQITFADGLTFTTAAADRDEAQEIAIEHFESVGVVHDSIISIRRVEVAA